MYRRIALIIEPGVFGIVSAFNLAGCGHRHHDRDLNICRAGSSLALDPRSKFAYVVNSGSNDVSTHTVDGTTGGLTSTNNRYGIVSYLDRRSPFWKVRLCDERRLQQRVGVQHRCLNRNLDAHRNDRHMEGCRQLWPCTLRRIPFWRAA